jgi:hypothetical protein
MAIRWKKDTLAVVTDNKNTNDDKSLAKSTKL